MRSSNSHGRHAVCAALIVMASTALAGTASAADQIQIAIEGRVEPSCGLSGVSGSLALGDITTAGERTLAFTVNCNSPFAYALVSANGGLAAQSKTKVIGGEFASLKPYSVGASFQTDLGMFGDAARPSSALTSAAAAPCVAAAFGSSCPFTTSGNGVAINKTGELTLQWEAASTPLLAGSFSDTITLTVRAL